MKNTTGDLGFNGQDNTDAPGSYNKKYQSNQSGKTMAENYGRGPTKAGVTGSSTGVTTAKNKILGSSPKVDCCMESYRGTRGPTKGNQ